MAQNKYFYELTISSSPHAHSATTTQTVMRDVLIALLPALIGSVVFFGFRALTVTLVSVAACMFFEWGYRKMMKLDSTAHDLSAAVTGVLLAFVCPVTVEYWMIVLGALFAIVVVKQLFGGIGKNFLNPALAGRAFMFSWPVAMATWIKVGFGNAASMVDATKLASTGADIVTQATPLGAMHQGYFDPALGTIGQLFWGNVGGSLGETSAFLLLIGFVYLLRRKVISARIPVAYILTVAVLAFLFPMGNDRFVWMAAQVFGGGLFLGAIFMATDYVTSPLTKKGQIIFGIGCGIITILIRYFGGYSEGVSYAILIMNCTVVLLDKVGRPVKFGAPKKEAAKK